MGAGSRGGKGGLKASGERARPDKKKPSSGGGGGKPGLPGRPNPIQDIRKIARVARLLHRLSKTSGASAKSVPKATLKMPTRASKMPAIKKPPKIKGNKIKVIRAKNQKLQ